jgi:methyl-accepting chemotaxis protein
LLLTVQVAAAAHRGTAASKSAALALMDTTLVLQTGGVDYLLDRLRQHNEKLAAEARVNADAGTRSATLQILAFVAFGVLTAVGLGILLAQRLASQAGAIERTVASIVDQGATLLAEALVAMVNQDLTVDVQSATPALAKLGQDELGRTAAATNRPRDRIVAMIGSDGRARVGLHELVGHIRVEAASVAETSAQLGSAAAQTGSAVQQVTMAVQNVASGAQETSRSAQEATSAVSQLSQVIDGIARGATDQARQVQTTSPTATRMAAGIEQVAASATQMASPVNRPEPPPSTVARPSARRPPP